MVWLQAGNVSDDWTRHEQTYTTDYARWNGYVSRLPVIRQIADIRAASILSSWRTKGPHDSQAATMLDKFSGGRNITLKLILANMYKIAWICGDAYAEKIYEGDDIVDLEILPSDNIRIVHKAGNIIRFEEIDGDAKWEPYQIFHLAYSPRGAIVHGLGMLEPLNNLLLGYEQMLQLGSEIYERMSRPRELILAKTDNQAKLQTIRDAIKAAGDTWSGIAVLPATLIEDVKDIQLTVSLKPQEWLTTIESQIFKATATPEIVLGQGYANSEESLAAHMAGFYGSIRYEQKWLAECMRKQIFEEMWPSNPPEIEFSFASELPDEKFERNLAALPVLESSQVIAPENKGAIIKEILQEMGLVR